MTARGWWSGWPGTRRTGLNTPADHGLDIVVVARGYRGATLVPYRLKGAMAPAGCDSRLWGKPTFARGRCSGADHGFGHWRRCGGCILPTPPDIRAGVASMARAVANADGNLGQVDAAEEPLVEEMRLMGLSA